MQNTQRRVEDALSEMLEQKNRLAYENGKLQSTLRQLTQELEEATREQGDIVQLRKLSQSLQAKYTQVSCFSTSAETFSSILTRNRMCLAILKTNLK